MKEEIRCITFDSGRKGVDFKKNKCDPIKQNSNQSNPTGSSSGTRKRHARGD